MTDFASIKSVLEESLAGDRRIGAAYLHGSFARGEARVDSDIDIGILPVAGQRFSDYDRAILSGELTALVGRTADVGEISSRNLVYAKEVLYKGIPVFIRDDVYAQKMTMTLLAMYAAFNVERKGVVDAWTA